MGIRLTLALSVMLIFCSGCGPRVMDERDVSLELGDIKPILFGPFKKEVTVTVSAKSPGAPISVYVFDSEQQEHVDYAITHGNEPRETWAGVASTEDAALTAVIPAGKEAVVRLQPTGREPAQVRLKISN